LSTKLNEAPAFAGALDYERSCCFAFFTNLFNSTEIKKLTVVPIAADRAILINSSPGILQRMTVSAPLIVPDRMENVLFIEPIFNFALHLMII
jgi:hypothetical protein